MRRWAGPRTTLNRLSAACASPDPPISCTRAPTCSIFPFWLLELEELLSLVVNEGDPNSADHKLCLTDRVQTLKRSALAEMGRGDAVATATVDSPVPYKLDDLLRWLKADDTEIIIRQPSGRVDPGPYNGKLGGLIARFEARMADPRFGFIFHPPEHTTNSDWLAETATKLLEAGPGDVGIKVLDFSEVPSPILPMVAGVFARLIYNVQFWMDPEDRTPVCIVCDEAHIYLPSREHPTPVQRVALTAFEAIAKEGRKYGVCVAVISQRPSDVSRTILSQCNNYVILRLTNDQDQHVIRHLVSATLSSLTGVLPMLDVGECVVIGDAILLPMRIKVDAPQLKPASVTMPYWKCGPSGHRAPPPSRWASRRCAISGAASSEGGVRRGRSGPAAEGSAPRGLRPRGLRRGVCGEWSAACRGACDTRLKRHHWIDWIQRGLPCRYRRFGRPRCRTAAQFGPLCRHVDHLFRPRSDDPDPVDGAVLRPRLDVFPDRPLSRLCAAGRCRR